MGEGRELGTVTDWEYRLKELLLASCGLMIFDITDRAEKKPVEVALICIHLECKTTRVTNGLSRVGAASDSGESTEQIRLLANLVQEGSRRHIIDFIGDLKVS